MIHNKVMCKVYYVCASDVKVYYVCACQVRDIQQTDLLSKPNEHCEAINTDWRWRDWGTDKIDLHIYSKRRKMCDVTIKCVPMKVYTHKTHLSQLYHTTSLTISFVAYWRHTFNLVRIMIIAKLQQMHACICR